MSNRENLLSKALKVINIGIKTFAEDLENQGVEVVHVEWHPPAGGDLEILSMLDRLNGDE
ncbi:MAG: fdrA domain protein [Candidatus Thorarchaeota archaeon]